MSNNKKSIIKQGIFKADVRIWGISIIANIIIALMMILLFRITYENQADMFMRNILEGPQNAHLVFSNYILGKILLILMKFIPMVPWYTLIQFIFVFLSLIGISRAILEHSCNAIGKLVVCIVLIFIGYEGYITPGYMRTACILTAAGIILLANSLMQGKKIFVVENILAIIIILVGSLYSFKVFLVCLAVSVILVVVYLIINNSRREKSNNIRVKLKMVLKYTSIMTIALIVAGGLNIVDQLEYKNTDSTGYVLTYRNSVEKYLSYGFNYKDVKNREIETLTKKARAKVTALTCGIESAEVEDVLIEIDDMTSQTRELSVGSLNSFFKNVPVSLFSIGVFYLGLALAIIYTAYSKKQAYIIMPSAIILLIGMFVLYMTYYLGTSWIYFVLMVPAILPMLLAVKEIENGEWKTAVAFAVVFFVVLYSVFKNKLNI